MGSKNHEYGHKRYEKILNLTDFILKMKLIIDILVVFYSYK